MAFTDFTDRFPKAQYPLVLGELSYRTFQDEAQLLPEALASEYIAPMETDELDDLTELLPVARWKGKEYVGVIYWKAGLLHNHYRLATFDKKGNPIDNRVIAGSYLTGDEITTSAATLTEDLIVYVVSGQEDLEGKGLGDAAVNSAIRLGIDDGGVIEELSKPEDN